MPTSTFYHLSLDKKLNIKGALLDEFSRHYLADAQVARIIKNAGIARGTFYKYFPNLIAAYRWLLSDIMDELQVHPKKLVQECGTSQEYQSMIHRLVTQINKSEYFEFLKMYYEANEALLSTRNTDHRVTMRLNSQQWAIMVLCHQTIKECLVNPHDQMVIETRLGNILSKIIGGSKCF